MTSAPRTLRRRASLRAGLVAAALVALAVPRAARAGEPSLVISLDREAAAPGEPFQCEIQLSISNGAGVEGFRLLHHAVQSASEEGEGGSVIADIVY